MESFRAGGDWKQGSVYLYVGTTDGVVVFHAVDPDLKGRNLYDLEDSNGVKIMQEILAAAAEGGGYVEYLWDDPAIAGDEETGSPKVGDAVPYTALGEEFILGSGFYPGSASTSARLRGGPGDGSKLALYHSPVAPIGPDVTSASCTGSPPAINLEKAVVRYRVKLSRWLVPSAVREFSRQHPRGTASPDFKRAVENPSMRPGQLRPGVRQPRELAGTALFSRWSENRATPYAPGPRFLPFYTVTPWNTPVTSILLYCN